MITGRLPSPQLAVEAQPVFELPRRQEVLAHEFPPRDAHLVGPRGIAQEVGRALRRGLDVVDEIAFDAVFVLERDPAAASTDDRPPLPEPFADGETEALAERLLHDDVGEALERVDLHVADLLNVR